MSRRRSPDYSSAIVTVRVAIVGDSKLGAAVGQVGNPDFFSAFLNDVVETAPGNGGEILAVRIAGTVLGGAGHTHVSLGLGEPRSNLRVVDRPVFSESVEVGGFEIDVTEASRRASPEVRLASGRLAALPIPIRSWSIGVGDVVLEQISALAVFRLLYGVGFLMGLVLETERITVAAIFEVVNLAVVAVVLVGIGARPGVESAKKPAATGISWRSLAYARAEPDDVVWFSAKKSSLNLFARVPNWPRAVFCSGSSDEQPGIFGQIREAWVADALQPNLRCVVSDDCIVTHHLEERAATFCLGFEFVFVGQFLQHAVLLFGGAIHKVMAKFGVAARVHPIQTGDESNLRIVARLNRVSG